VLIPPKVNDDTTQNGKLIVGIKRLLPPPVIGVVVALLTVISPVGPWFISTAEKRAPLAAVFNSIQNLRRACNPLALLVLTSSLAIGIGLSKSTPKADFFHDDNTDVGMLRIFACVFMSRFLISPLLMVSMLNGMARIGLAEESAMWFVLILEPCMPPAQNSVLMLQVADYWNPVCLQHRIRC
jgi:predicted permease